MIVEFKDYPLDSTSIKEALDLIKRSPETQKALTQLRDKLELTLRQLSDRHKTTILIVGGRSRWISDTMLDSIAMQLYETDPLKITIASRIRLGIQMNKAMYLNHFTDSIDDLGELRARVEHMDPAKYQIIVIDDHGTSGGKANGSVNRLRSDLSNPDVKFIYLASKESLEFPPETKEHILVLTRDFNTYKFLSLFSVGLSNYIRQRIDNIFKRVSDSPLGLLEKIRALLANIFIQDKPITSQYILDESVSYESELKELMDIFKKSLDFA